MHYSYLYPLKSPTGFAYTLSTGEKKNQDRFVEC